MTDTSARMGLILPTQVDPFNTEDIYNNWNKVDAAPGTHICTSTTRPSTWSAAQAGRKIMETDTGLEWWFDGTDFKRLLGLGLLKKNDGTFAIGERTTNFSTGSITYVQVVAVTTVVVPDGNRPIEVVTSWFSSSNADQDFLFAIFQSNVNNSGPQTAHWVWDAEGGTFSTLIRNGLAAGSYNFSLQVRCQTTGQTTTVNGDSSQPVTISVLEK